MTLVTPEPAFKAPRSHAMTQATDTVPNAANDEQAVINGAWLGPAIGASILAVVWALYLVYLLIDIFALG